MTGTFKNNHQNLKSLGMKMIFHENYFQFGITNVKPKSFKIEKEHLVYLKSKTRLK